MKDNQHCPKCKSKQVVMLAGKTFLSKVYPFGFEETGYSTIARYACTECGFMEEYLVDPKELAALKKKLT